MEKIGILTCTNTTQDVGCSSMACFNDFNAQSGEFKRYETDGAEIVGIVNCAGCPTVVAPEKILNKIELLTFNGATSVHFSTCLMILCPFKAKYKKVIKERFPGVEIVEGTHEAPENATDFFRSNVKEMLCGHSPNMKDFAEKIKAMETA